MIATVTCNAAIDKTYFVPGFGLSGVHRFAEMIAVPGGKGVNVARVAAQLGMPVVSSGFVAGFNGQFIRQGLDQEGIAHDFVELPGESRICLNILDPDASLQTELLEPGPPAGPDDVERLREKLRTLTKTCRYVIFSGSLPNGCPPETYARLIQDVRAAGAEAILDASGAALAEGMKAKPFLIKPNEEELAKLLGIPSAEESDAALFIRRTMGDGGIRAVIVSLGARGALAGFDGTLYRVELPQVAAVNPVGSGDAMVAGCVTGLVQGLPAADVLRLGAACGTANALERQAGCIDPATVETLLGQIRVTRV